jgi:hypothetical protein
MRDVIQEQQKRKKERKIEKQKERNKERRTTISWSKNQHWHAIK